jgi:hypothetical protein
VRLAWLGAAALLASPAAADPPLPRPDYLLSLPDGQWAVAEKLWEGHSPCTPHLCEAGYHSGGLVLSVVRGENYFRAVAGVTGCASVSEQIVAVDHPEALPAKRRLAIVVKLAKGVSETARQTCKVHGPPVDTVELRAL